ncbi:hypothetical protein LTR36_003550 [Oleoguttula mirabilis]|uniref:Xylanolytic transcriptional activator regulatory domain-containing protein n=1 Tax=Oleoguttula mirabilis TaxID=1507867 RepID=A0AAV9JK84_9PEZI|nr:hypothetical protein LTR36_003550 [Oleoguttula mirabilis]
MSDVSTRQAPEVKERQRSEQLKRKLPTSTVKQEKDDTGVLQHNAASSTSERSPCTANSLLAAELIRDRERDQEPLFSGPRNRMPYFRWLGPTAIMPGFKQMVVKVKRQDTDMARSSSDSMVSPSLNKIASTDQLMPLLYSGTPGAVESDVRTPLNLPFYDTSPMPPSELITHLGDTFFTHLGCNYPFLQRERFLRDLEEKQVDAILVDAVCALAARFSTHVLLTQQPHEETKPSPADFGHAFAQRAKSALMDTFTCPSVAAVQAALLLAYNEFGESRDSGLWMYLGIAIRMAQDLGMHRIEGLKYKGKDGPTPKMVKRESLGGGIISDPVEKAVRSSETSVDDDDQQTDEKQISERKAAEQERVDTFWALFFLDRVVSSGTGRRSTLRDKDVELSFPSLGDTDAKSGWPAAFPALIRIVHLYGRVADLLNTIKEPSDITSETPKRLAAMESQVTQFYQGLSPRLHFDAVNFQHYMKAEEGTNFVLLHFWFHTLIVLLHQPTLLKTFAGRMLQLFPNSQQLSMSSAKTIADILSYSQLMDAKASLGNPFTSQPIYIAACAFLKETAEQTATSNAQSRANSPTRKDLSSDSAPSGNVTPQNIKKPSGSGSSSNGKRTPTGTVNQRSLAKHTLLATAATQHYQLCYKALQSLETYWSGTKYILTVLDQKFAGVGDPLLYTAEEGEGSMEQPKPELAFTSPGWRRKLSCGPYLRHPNAFFRAQGLGSGPESPRVDPNKAVGWTLTGTMNSPSTNVAWHIPSGGSMAQCNREHPGHTPMAPIDYDMVASKLNGSGHYAQQALTGSASAQTRPPLPSHPSAISAVSNADADLLLGLGSPYPHESSHQATPGSNPLAQFSHHTAQLSDMQNPASSTVTPLTLENNHYFCDMNSQNLGDMMIESQDVDMSMLGLHSMPWFNSYSSYDTFSMFDPGGAGSDAQGGAT